MKLPTIQILSICLLMLTIRSMACQTTKPVIGAPMPEFTLTQVTHYPKKEVTLADFKGKWLILDFWFTGCTSAIKSLPRMNALYLEFKDRIQLMMVGVNGGRYKHIEAVYEVLREKYDLQLPSAYDSVLYAKWDIWSMPCIIIIDPDGVVRHITTGRDMDREKLHLLLNGEPVKFHVSSVPSNYDVSEFPGTKDTSLVYRSILTRWRGERIKASHLSSYDEWPEPLYEKGIILVGFSLGALYKIAYTGIDRFNNASVMEDGSLVYPRVILEVMDPTPFWYDSTYSAHSGYRGLYNYNLSIVGAHQNDWGHMKKVFQAELRNVFGYNVGIEEREFEVIRISAKRKDVEKLATRGGEREILITPVRMRLQNVPMETFYRLLVYRLTASDRVFIEKNETGFDGNINIDLQAVLTDLGDVESALKQFGFSVVKEKRRLKAVIIRDALPN